MRKNPLRDDQTGLAFGGGTVTFKLLGAGFPRPLSKLRPVDGQFRGRSRESAQEGVLIPRRIVPDDRRRVLEEIG
jgi:hypothetical protein